jgi:CheY-like chemotaxis protein
MSAGVHPVLVVEDDIDIREAMVAILEGNGYQVRAAANGADALLELQGGNLPCLILLDLMMPVMDGWTFCQEKDKDPAFSDIPVLVVSAVAPRDPRNACLRAIAHLSKPLDIGNLLATVERHC